MPMLGVWYNGRMLPFGSDAGSSPVTSSHGNCFANYRHSPASRSLGQAVCALHAAGNY